MTLREKETKGRIRIEVTKTDEGDTCVIKQEIDVPKKAKVKVFVQKPYTFVQLIGKYGKIVSVGFAKCNPYDEWNDAMGISIALGRAVKKLARETCKEFTIYDMGKVTITK